jgi:hypothetical protein
MNKKVIDYKVVSEKDVKEYIDEGWQPWGSPMHRRIEREFDSDIVRFYQAMVKYEEGDSNTECKEPSEYHRQKMIECKARLDSQEPSIPMLGQLPKRDPSREMMETKYKYHKSMYAQLKGDKS